MHGKSYPGIQKMELQSREADGMAVQITERKILQAILHIRKPASRNQINIRFAKNILY
jgi:hypothetical protein